MRRILKEIELSKIAAVDRPAQEGALVTIMKRKPQVDDDPDDDGTVDDWSKKPSRKKQKQPKGWSRDDIDEVNHQVNKRKVKPPFEHLVDNLARGHGVPKYVAQSLARRQSPQSYRHYQQAGVAASQSKPITKALPDADVASWDQAVHTYATNLGLSRCDAMTEIRKRAPNLFAKFRRSK